MMRKYRTVVLEVLSRLPRLDRVPHSGVEDLSGPCRPKTRQKTVLKVSATRCGKQPARGVREHLPRTDDHTTAQYYVVLLEVPEETAEW